MIAPGTPVVLTARVLAVAPPAGGLSDVYLKPGATAAYRRPFPDADTDRHVLDVEAFGRPFVVVADGEDFRVAPSGHYAIGARGVSAYQIVADDANGDRREVVCLPPVDGTFSPVSADTYGDALRAVAQVRDDVPSAYVVDLARLT